VHRLATRPLLIGVVAIVAFAVGALLARAMLRPSGEAQAPAHATVYPEPRTLPAISLTDQDGRPLDGGFFERGWTLVFFGFTNCPDVCPTTLATLASTLASLDDLPAPERPRVLLVSVDPERDHPEVLAAYVRQFDPAFLAATGEPSAIAAVAGGFGVPLGKVASDAGSYTVDHGAGIFIVAPDGIAAYSSAPHDASVLARDYRLILAGHGTSG
jgi:protein SCO1